MRGGVFRYDMSEVVSRTVPGRYGIVVMVGFEPGPGGRRGRGLGGGAEIHGNIYRCLAKEVISHPPIYLSVIKVKRILI